MQPPTAKKVLAVTVGGTLGGVFTPGLLHRSCAVQDSRPVQGHQGRLPCRGLPHL